MKYFRKQDYNYLIDNCDLEEDRLGPISYIRFIKGNFVLAKHILENKFIVLIFLMRLRESTQLRINRSQSSLILEILERLKTWLILGSAIEVSYLLQKNANYCTFKH